MMPEMSAIASGVGRPICCSTPKIDLAAWRAEQVVARPAEARGDAARDKRWCGEVELAHRIKVTPASGRECL